MKYSDLIDKHFPFEKFNPGQKEAINFAVENLVNGKKHVLMELPTGIGKSAIATTTHKVLHALAGGDHKTAIITVTKGLQDQYLRDDESIADLKGSKNYSCPRGAGHYKSAKCMQLCAGKLCNPNAGCPYVAARKEFLTAPLRITNTSFQIKAPMVLLGDDTARANLTIIDECHELDEQLIHHAAITIDMGALSHLEKITSAQFLGNFAVFINEFVDMNVGHYFTPDDNIKKYSAALIIAIEKQLSDFDKLPGSDKDGSTLLAKAELASVLEVITSFAYSQGEWIIEEFAYANKLVLTPVYANQVSKKGMFDKSDTFIHMSATICGFDEYMKTVGINPNDAAVIDATNPIPKEQRPVYALNAVKVSGQYDREQLAKIVDLIIARHDTNNNGVIHTVQFQLAKDILSASKHKRRMLISNDRNEILAFLKRKGSILLSPSVESGYDFKDDLARWQIIAKVPFEYLGNPRTQLLLQRFPKWYARQAILRIVQAQGRAVRGIDDYATTYILDSNFDRLYKSNQELFPDWFKEAVHIK